MQKDNAINADNIFAKKYHHTNTTNILINITCAVPLGINEKLLDRRNSNLSERFIMHSIIFQFR